jgi:hypothetical protein
MLNISIYSVKKNSPPRAMDSSSLYHQPLSIINEKRSSIVLSSQGKQRSVAAPISRERSQAGMIWDPLNESGMGHKLRKPDPPEVLTEIFNDARSSPDPTQAFFLKNHMVCHKKDRTKEDFVKSLRKRNDVPARVVDQIQRNIFSREQPAKESQ